LPSRQLPTIAAAADDFEGMQSGAEVTRKRVRRRRKQEEEEEQDQEQGLKFSFEFSRSNQNQSDVFDFKNITDKQCIFIFLTFD
jgi:hypothetical protein